MQRVFRRVSRRWKLVLAGAVVTLLLVPYPAQPQDGSEIVFGAVSAGGFHTCALSGSGSAYCWGLNLWGQVGSGTLDPDAGSLPPFGPGAYGEPGRARVASPVRVATELVFASISAGDRHTCALTRGGRAYCWGHNAFGQLGDGTTTHRARPVPVVGGIVFSRLSAGGTHTCGVTVEGTLYCWGGNWHGQLGVGREAEYIPSVASPTSVASSARFRDVAAGGVHTCALDVDGRPYCWGDRRDGVLGTGRQEPEDVFTPRPVAGRDRYRSLSAGPGLTCAINVEDRLRCWGLFATRARMVTASAPREVGDSSGAAMRQVSVGPGTICIVSDRQRLVDPGLAVEAACGDPRVYLSEIVAVSAGGNAFGEHACVLLEGGAIECWGSDSRGQLGGLRPEA